MAISLKSDYMLESLHKSMESNTKLVKTLSTWNMAYDVSKSSLTLQFSQLFLKPVDLKTRVVSVVHQEPIQIVANIHIQSQHSSFGIKFKGFGVVPILLELNSFLLRQPVRVCPYLFQMVYLVVAIWRFEILNIYRPSVVIA
jgi:hypothetical protein